MKKVLGIIGVGLLAGIAIYMLLNKRKKIKNNIYTCSEKTPEDSSSDNIVSIINQNDTYDANIPFKNVKASALGNMSARHEEASNIIKKTIDIICSRTEIPADENSDLDQLSDELDELLSEE
ncbi:MAG: hypothetical protein WBI07_07265 [Mobilitalea sp.]